MITRKKVGTYGSSIIWIEFDDEDGSYSIKLMGDFYIQKKLFELTKILFEFELHTSKYNSYTTLFHREKDFTKVKDILSEINKIEFIKTIDNSDLDKLKEKIINQHFLREL